MYIQITQNKSRKFCSYFQQILEWKYRFQRISVFTWFEICSGATFLIDASSYQKSQFVFLVRFYMFLVKTTGAVDLFEKVVNSKGYSSVRDIFIYMQMEMLEIQARARQFYRDSWMEKHSFRDSCSKNILWSWGVMRFNKKRPEVCFFLELEIR